MSWTNAELCEALKTLYPKEKTSTGHITSLEHDFRKLQLDLHPMEPSRLTQFISEVFSLFHSRGLQLPQLTAEDSKVLIDALKTKLKNCSKFNLYGKQLHSSLVQKEVEDNSVKTLMGALTHLETHARSRALRYQEAMADGMTWETSATKRKGDFDSDASSVKRAKPAGLIAVVAPKGSKTCVGCGRTHDSPCLFKLHPMFNKTNRSWAESENGRILSTFGVQVLNPHKNVVDNNLVDFDWKVGTPPFSIHADNNRHVISTIRGHCLVDGQPSSITRSNDEQQGTTLLDSGALDANYITSSYLQILCDNKCNLKFRHANERVTAAFGSSTLSKKRVVMNFTLTHGRTKYNLHNEEFKVLDRMPFDVIIGLPCIRRHDLTRVFRVHFVDNQEPVAGLKGTVRAVTTNTSSNPTAGDSWLFAMGSKTVYKSILLDTEYDDDAIEQFTHEAPWDNPPLNLEADVSYLIYGDLELREKLHALCHQNRDIFSKAVGPTPASLPPFQMEVDKTQWERSMNRTPLRPQTAAKIMAAQKFIRQALADGVIVPSQAPYWSQVLLTPKKDGNFRFCLDYRNLNKCTKSMGWPLPNIASTLQRIGSHKPKYFAVLDLTSGYHQCPISIDSQDYTSFLTSEGLFKWTRLPMGPKGAPSYFQQHMCTTILAGLIHIILEVYLDDIIVFASTEGEYLQRIQTVFDRLRKFNITLNPDKCRFGLNKVEYVGYTIDETGLHFSQEKLEKF